MKSSPQKTDQETVPLSSIHLNDGKSGLPKNPRFIRDERFAALCTSIRDNPEYMPARPIIVNEDGCILGGNMRFRACKANGMTTVPASWIQRVVGWSIDKQKRFIIMDNRGFGEDDFDALANEWEVEDLIAAGFTEADLGIFDNANKVEDEYKDMPDCDNEDNYSGPVLIVRFADENAKLDFGAVVGKKITKETKTMWFPDRPQALIDQSRAKEGVAYESKISDLHNQQGQVGVETDKQGT